MGKTSFPISGALPFPVIRKKRSNQKQEAERLFWMTMLVLYAFAMGIYTVFLFPKYYSDIRFVSANALATTSFSNDESDPDRISKSSGGSKRKWRVVRRGLRATFRNVQMITIILLLSFSLLLLVGRVFRFESSRTSAIAAFIFCLNSLVTSTLFLSKRHGLNSKMLRYHWVEASRNLRTAKSIEFWACLSTPVCSLVWTFAFCAQVLITGWLGGDDVCYKDGNDWTVWGILVLLLVLVGNTVQTRTIVKKFF